MYNLHEVILRRFQLFPISIINNDHCASSHKRLMRYSAVEVGSYIYERYIPISMKCHIYEKRKKRKKKRNSLNAVASLLNNVNICKYLLRYF